MTEKTNTVTVSRRSTRLFVEEQQLMEAGNAGQLGFESRYPSGDEKEIDRPQREGVISSSSIQVLKMPVVDLGKSLCPIFPATLEDIGKQGTFVLVEQHLIYALLCSISISFLKASLPLSA
jgi:tyrosine-protein phosphatase SIW14